MLNIAIIAAFAGFLIGCATPYQPKGLTGGYEEVEVKPGVYFLTVRGNGYTSGATVQQYWHRRAAELCAANGKVVKMLDARVERELFNWGNVPPSLVYSSGSTPVSLASTNGYVYCESEQGRLGVGTGKDSARHEALSQQPIAQIPQSGSDLNANPQAVKDELEKVGQGFLYSIAMKTLGNDPTITSQPGEISGLIGHSRLELLAVMGKPTNEDLANDPSVLSYVTRRTTKTGQPLICTLLYGIMGESQTVVSRKIWCE